MKNFQNLIRAFGLVFFFILIYTSCRKEAGSSSSIPQGQQRVSIRLSDNPVKFQAVNVDIQSVAVQVIPDSCKDRYRYPDHCAAWDTLDIRPGVYNLLDLANGTDTILASGLTVTGQITKIRLILGTSNSVVIDSVSYPLTLWNNDNTVTIALRGEDVDQISVNDLQFWLDFDAARSIVRVRQNQFVLRPFLRVWLPAHTASIKGYVLPDSAQSVVAAVFNGDTLVAFPRPHDGYFKIRGITSTSSDLFINATANGYQDTTLTGISLSAGQTTDVGTIHLHQ